MNHDKPTGQQLRDAGVDAVLAADEAVHRGHREAIDAALDKLIAAGAEFSADDLQLALDDETRRLAPPNLLSAVIAVAAASNPPADSPYAPMRFGSMFSSAAWLRAQRTAARASSAASKGVTLSPFASR